MTVPGVATVCHRKPASSWISLFGEWLQWLAGERVTDLRMVTALQSGGGLSHRFEQRGQKWAESARDSA